MRTALKLDRESGEALRLIEVLAGRRPRHAFDPRILPRQDRPGPLVEAVARTVTAACTGLLLEHGAAPRTVLRRGQRISGRIWDPEVNAIDGVPLSLRFSPATGVLWREAVTVLGELLFSDRTGPERRRKLFRGFGNPPASTAGDHLWFALAHHHLPRLRLPIAEEGRARARLRTGSALARLLAPHEDGPPFDGALLDDPHTLRTIELLLPWIGRQWALALPSLWGADDLAQALARCRAFRETLSGWVDALDRRGRLDLLDPAIAALSEVPRQVPPELRERLVRVRGVSSLAERDQLAQALGSALDPGILDGPRATLQACRYGDERFAEAQLGLRLLEERWLPRREEAIAAVRRLEGRLG